jgi:hypothetical protein
MGSSTMKSKTAPVSTAAASARQPPPGNEDLKKLMGRAFGPLAKVTGWLRLAQPAVTIEERFHAETGWHQIYLLKKRRLFYLTPKQGDFRFAMILGDKAIVRLRQGPLAAQIQPLLKNAKRYPEGTAFIFDAKSFKPELIITLLEAKLAC